MVSEAGQGDAIGLTSRQGYHPASSLPLNVASTSCILDRTWIRRPPLEILAELQAIEQEILKGMEELEGMLRSTPLTFRYHSRKGT